MGINCFLSSWRFAPYTGSPDINTLKMLMHIDMDCDAVQMKRTVNPQERCDRILDFPMKARIKRHEIDPPANMAAMNQRRHFVESCVDIYKALRKQKKYDVLVSRSTANSSHDAAYRIKTELDPLPWLAVVGDPIGSRHPYVKELHAHKDWYKDDERIEQVVFEHADMIIVPSRYQKQITCSGGYERYESKITVLPHAFEPSFYPVPEAVKGRKLSLVFTGTLYDNKKRSSKVFLDVLDRLFLIYPVYREKIVVRFYGEADNHLKQVLAEKQYGALIEHYPTVDYLASLRAIKNADVLLLWDGNFTIEEDGVDYLPFLPGKLLDYLGARNTLFAMTPEAGATADILNDVGIPHVTGLDLDRAALHLKRCIDGQVKADWAKSLPYSAQSVGRQFEGFIRRYL